MSNALMALFIGITGCAVAAWIGTFFPEPFNIVVSAVLGLPIGIFCGMLGSGEFE